MGQSSCKITPSVSRRFGSEIVTKPSKLFQSLYAITKDREATKYLWALSKSPSFRESATNLKYDEMGEVTYTSLIESLNLADVMESFKNIDNKKEEYGLKKGSAPTTFDNYQAALRIAETINNKEDKYVGIVQKKGENAYIVDLVSRNAASLSQAEEVSFTNALNNELLKLLRDLGFDVSVVADPRFEGLFDPTNATFVNGLIQAIKIAKGELGEQAFPEEFCHLFLEGLMHNPLVQRLLNTIDEATVKEVLGEQYEAYSKQYNNDSARMQKEAAGKLLAEYIKNKGTVAPAVKPRKSLLSRIWGAIKSLLSKTKDTQLSTSNSAAREAIAEIYKGITDRSLIKDFNVKEALSGEELYKLEERSNSLQKLANRGMTLSAKSTHLQQVRSLKGRYSNNAKVTMEQIQSAYENEHYIKSISLSVSNALQEIRDLNTQLRALADTYDLDNLKSSTDLVLLKQMSKILHRYEELKEGYTDYMATLATLDSEENAEQVGLSEEDAATISEAANSVLKALNVIGASHAAFRYDTIYAFTRMLYGEDRAKGIGSDRDKVVTLEKILDHANRDLGFMDRYISAMNEADDILLTLIDKAVKQKKYERDQELIQYKAVISKLDEELRQAGYSTDFMFEKDANGVPTGKLISEYDFDTYNKELREFVEAKREKGLEGAQLHDAIERWKHQNVNGQPRLIPVFLSEDHREEYKEHPELARYPEMVPNPAVYTKYANRITSLPKAQQEYYRKMIALKKQMMEKIPSRGQRIYRAIYISKSDIDGILTNNDGNAGRATLESVKKRFIRRADDIGFGEIDLVKESILEVLNSKKDLNDQAEEIIKIINENLEDDEFVDFEPRKIRSIIKKKYQTPEEALDRILTLINSCNFFHIDTDFAGHTIEKLPIYYSRKLKDMRMLSLDFSGSMTAYVGMAVNYDKMNEIIDVLELTRGFTKERAVRELQGNKEILTKFDVLGKAYTSLLSREGGKSNIGGRIDDYFKSAIYEVRKNDEGSFDFIGKHLDTAKTLDAIKDYTGLLGLGLNTFSAISNVLMGKLQQWIEAAGGEYFNYKDYGTAIKQYHMLLPGCIGEMSSQIKKNKLSLLIDKFDAMHDYYDKLRESNYYSSTTARLLSKSGETMFVGMNAGEHLLHCQTMLAILNNIKLTDKDGNNPISLFDALEVKENEELGVTELVLKDGLYYEKESIDPKTGKPVKDEKGKIKKTRVEFTEENLFKIKSRISGVNSSLNGAFSADDKGAIHKYALGRLAMQFRQWMPAHYYRRFARSHYDSQLEQWREGYYVTLFKFTTNLVKGIKQNGFDVASNFSQIKDTLSEHEKANLKRAYTEIALFAVLTLLCKLGGRVKEKSDVWGEKMLEYQLNRMRLECGASVPSGSFFSNIFSLLQSPAAAIKTGEHLAKVLNFGNMLDEITVGPYAGWSEWEKDVFTSLPGLPQAKKAWDMDDSLVSWSREQ